MVTVSNQVVPAPTLSPLNADYTTELVSLCDTLNGLRANALTSHTFESLNGFAQVMTGLIAAGKPYRLSYAD